MGDLYRGSDHNYPGRRGFVMPEYEIYALKYAGPLRSSGAFLMWLRDWDTVEERNYYIWCIKGNGETVIVDTGVSPDLAREKDLAGYVSPAEVLSRIDVEAEEVRRVILTHIHWDHASGTSLFPKAMIYVQEREYRFWLEDRIAKRPPFKYVTDETSLTHLAALEKTDRLVLLKGDQEILPGIECLFAPGHTVGLQAVAVKTAKGTAILGSDCAHVFKNYREDWPSALIVDLVGWMRTYEKLRARASSIELLFPGHDVLMHEHYPAVAEGVTRLV
ncbi:MAG: MBL fold metallo-hydrolase [Proteobacteria bacterium]|nr:MBL fold metallo-hydrolase [Pseudomonadota bacterium]NIS68393.1 MBL fold metallo-hydrolase [Pseudomonadota bacterium]